MIRYSNEYSSPKLLDSDITNNQSLYKADLCLKRDWLKYWSHARQSNQSAARFYVASALYRIFSRVEYRIRLHTNTHDSRTPPVTSNSELIIKIISSNVHEFMKLKKTKMEINCTKHFGSIYLTAGTQYMKNKNKQNTNFVSKNELNKFHLKQYH